MVRSSTYPSLERKLGGPDNWIERVGGLPQYIERIAKHLHYEKGFTISHAIATAVNTVKRWARKGGVVKYNDPQNNKVTTITAAQAAADVADWERKKAMARAGAGGGSRGRLASRSVRLSEAVVDVQALADRANAVADPAARAAARMQVLDLATKTKDKSLRPQKCKYCKEAATKRILHSEGMAYIPVCSEHLSKGKIDAAKSTPSGKSDPSNINSIVDLANARTKDGRKSYKRQGRWGHGFVPLDEAAKQSKAKGSPIAKKRMNRLYSGGKAAAASRAAVKRTLEQRAAKGAAHGTKLRSDTGRKDGGQQERVQRVAQSLHADIRDATRTQRQMLVKTKKEIGKGRQNNPRATQPWEQIPSSQKVIRGGKRYVMSTFNGRNLLTEWVGNNAPAAAPTPGDRQYSRVMVSQLEKMSTGDLRKLLRSGKHNAALRKKIRKVLDAKQAKNRSRG